MYLSARRNQEIIKNAVDKVEGASLPVYPSAASMMVIDISKHKANPQAVQDKLLYENDIFVRAGNYVSTRFGEKFIRVSFSIPTPEFGGDYSSIVPMIPTGKGTSASHLTWSEDKFVEGEATIIEL